MSTINNRNFLAETKTKMSEICANFQSCYDRSATFFDSKKHPLSVLFTEDFMTLYQGQFGYGTFETWRNCFILQIAAESLRRTNASFVINVSEENSQIILENISAENPGVLTLSPNGKIIFSIDTLIYPEFDVDEIFSENKAKLTMDKIFSEENKKKS